MKIQMVFKITWTGFLKEYDLFIRKPIFNSTLNYFLNKNSMSSIESQEKQNKNKKTQKPLEQLSKLMH